MSNASDFIIENGILKEYVGPGGDVVIPEGVTSIGNKAFWLSHVVCVVIPDSVTSIETRAFEYCELLQKVVMSKNINEIGIGIFNECRALSNIQIPNGVKKIWWNAFSYCSSLSHITIPDSVESIENGAFLGCDSLKIHITDISILPSGIRRNAAICFLEDGGDPLDPRSSSHYKFIKSNAGRMMDQMIANPEMLVVMLREKMLTPKNALAYLDAAQAAGNAEAIALMLDYNTNNLTSAEKKRVEKQTEVLEDTVFDRRVMRQGKEGINGLSFVVTGAVETFSNREELKKFIESQGGSVVSAISSKVDYLIMNNDVVDTVKRQKAEELGIEVITERRFNEMAQRTMQIEKILYNTKSVLKKYFGPGGDVVIPQTINEIKEMAFADCALITSIQIPDSVVHIGAYAFKNCTSLAGITIPSSIRNLNGSVFSGCAKLADADGFIILGNTFYGYVGEREKIEIPDTVQKIGAGAFRECMTVKSVTLPSSIHTIECEIFSGNKRLESIFIPDSVSSIGALTFAGCKKLKAFTIPDSVIVIGDLAFADCTALKCIAIPASVVQISATAFRGCKKLSLHAPAGSYAETYAKENNIPFVAE